MARILIVLLLPAALAGCRLPGVRSTGLPADWMGSADSAPEDLSSLPPRTESEVGGTVERILGVHQSVLDRLSLAGADCPEGSDRWHLGGMVTSFGITLSGVLGILTGTGTSAAQAVWHKHHEGHHFPGDGPVGGSGIRVRAASAPVELSRQLEPSIQAALRSGAVRDEAALRRNLNDTALAFRSMVRALDGLSIRSRRWDVREFRLEVQFDAGGSPVPWVSAGSTASFRFDWVRGANGLTALGSPDRLARKVRDFVQAMARDLDVLESGASGMERQRFALREVRLGVGMTAGGSFGLVQAATQMKGSLVFKSVETGAPAPLLEEADEGSLDLITASDRVNRSALLASGLSYSELSATDPGLAVVHLRRSSFRKGLRRAHSIAGFFIRHAAAVGGRQWGLEEISTEFDTSLSGSLGLSTLGGTGEVELTYENLAF